MYEKSSDLAVLAAEVIAKNDDLEHLRDEELSIVFLRCDKAKKHNGKIKYADCEKLNDKHAALSGYQFAITFYKDSEGMSGKQLEITMYHELLHVGWDGETASIIPHDCEDFTAVLEKYGLNWAERE